MQQTPKRGAGPAGDPDSDEDDEIIEAVIDEGRPAPRRKPQPAPRPDDDADRIPDGAQTWGDRHGPTMYVVGCLVVMGVLMTLQSTC